MKFGGSVTTTFIAFSGAMSPKLRTVPAYQGNGTSMHLSANRMLVSDPSLILTDELRLAWYGGSRRQADFQDVLTEIIRSFVGSTRAVLFGPSGGGFTALLQASRLPGSTAIVSNPQTDVKRFNRVAVERYLRIAWGIGSLDEGPLPFVDEVISIYERPVAASVVYVQNAGDVHHVENHLAPFLDRLHPANQVVQLIPDLGPGHIGPDKESFARLFSVVCDEPDWAPMVASVQALEITRNM